MIKDKKAGENFDEIGKRWYNFDSKIEKRIYRYLCCFHIKKWELKSLGNDLKFETFQQWKQYVCNKYSNYRSEELMEFSRYLNKEIRYEMSFQKYWIILFPIMVSIMLSVIAQNIINMIFDMFQELILINNFQGEILHLCILMGLMMLIIRCVIKMMYPFLENTIDKDFYTDYKEIIDEIINEKTK